MRFVGERCAGSSFGLAARVDRRRDADGRRKRSRRYGPTCLSGTADAPTALPLSRPHISSPPTRARKLASKRPRAPPADQRAGRGGDPTTAKPQRRRYGGRVAVARACRDGGRVGAASPPALEPRTTPARLPRWGPGRRSQRERASGRGGRGLRGPFPVRSRPPAGRRADPHPTCASASPRAALAVGGPGNAPEGDDKRAGRPRSVTGGARHEAL